MSDTPRTDKLYEEVWRFTNETDAVDALMSMRDFCRELERENAARRNEIARLNGQTMWICSCGGTDCAGQKENAELQKALLDAEELERYSGDGRRQWGRCSAWLHPDDAVVIISAKAIDSARKKAHPSRTDHSGGINEMMQGAKEVQP